MQKIIFTTSMGSVEIGDVNCSSVTGEKILRLSGFDGNSKKNRLQAVQCIGMAGQRVLSALPEVQTVTADIAFAPVYWQNNRFICTGAPGMYALRREVLSRFPLGVPGTLKYINDAGEYEIQARIDEVPLVSVKSGHLCECRLSFTADYPYWSRTVQSDKKTVTGGGLAAVFDALDLGDAESPISGVIHCTSTMSAASPDCFKLSGGGSDIHFVKPLSENEELWFSLEYGNELIVKKRIHVEGSYVTAWEDAYDHIDFPADYKPCRVGARQTVDGVPMATEFGFQLYSGGACTVQLSYHYLFNAI